MIVPDRIDAGAVSIPGALDAFERPGVGRPDRKTWRTVAYYFNAGDVLQHDLGELDIREERFRALLARPLVGEAVTCQLVPPLDDAAHELREAFRDPTQREERRARPVLLQHGENAIDVRLDAAFTGVPLATRDE